MKEEHAKWYSHTLGKEMDILIYGHHGYPVLLFPSSQGRYYEAKDFKLIEAVRWYLEQGLVKIYCPDSIDSMSWYNEGIHPAERVRNHNLYDKYLVEELMGKIRHETGQAKICVTGPSFGAFHALNIAFRHPEMVSHLFAMSGKYDIKSFMGGHYNDDVFYNNPIDYVQGSQNPHLWNMKIILGAGEHDICRDATVHMSEILKSKNIDHWLDIRQGQEHDWPLWKEMFPHYLSMI